MLRILTTGKPPKGTGKLSEVIEMLITLNKVAATSVCVCVQNRQEIQIK